MFDARVQGIGSSAPAIASSLREDAGRCTVDDCPVCRRLRTPWQADAQAPDKSTAPAIGGEAIVDALGFCGPHGARLERDAAARPAIVDALHTATRRLIDWLPDEHRFVERFFGALFAADHMCPSCRIRDHRAAGIVRAIAAGNAWRASPSSLCFAHFRDLVHQRRAEDLVALADAKLRQLDRLLARLEALGVADTNGAAIGSAEPTHDDATTFAAASRAIAGDEWHDRAEAPSRDDDRAADADRPPSMDARCDCPVCAEILDAEAHWMDAVHDATRSPADRWIVLPTCSMHIAQCLRAGDLASAEQVVRYAVAMQRDVVAHGIDAIRRDIAKREIARQSVFYRRISPHYILGQQRKTITVLPPCPGCARTAIARERAITRALHALHARPPREQVLAKLCLKHFCAVYLLASIGEPRARLANVMRERLSQLAASLEHAAAPAAGAALRDAMRIWRSPGLPRAERR